MNFLDYANQKMRDSNLRVTASRILVLKSLVNAKKPMNPYEIASAIENEGRKVDVVTIYRIIEVFEAIGLVHKVGKGYMSCGDYECEDETHCHHSFLCENCDEAFEFHVDDQDFLNLISQKMIGFVIKSHHFELAGLCNKCK